MSKFLYLRDRTPLATMKNILLGLLILVSVNVQAQRIVYSEPDKDDGRNLKFEIIGKLNGFFHIYKGDRNEHHIALYNNEMKIEKRQELDFLPDRILNVDFLNYNDYYYMVYQYQRKNIVHLEAIKLDGQGNKIGDAKLLDTTEVSFSANNKLYTVINSENKQNIAAFKINAKNEKSHVVITVLMDNALEVKRKSRLAIPMPDRYDQLSEFNLDNAGNIVFLKTSGTSSGENISKVTIIRQKPGLDEYQESALDLMALYLDDIKLKVNNKTNQYLVSSFFSKNKRGNIEGLYVTLWDRNTEQGTVYTSLFNDELRSEARGESALRQAFNDYYIQNIYLRKDGGFMVASEALYTSSRGGGFNRWDNYGQPFYSSSDYYMWRNFGGLYSPWSRNGFYNNVTRYYADNILLLSYDPAGKLEWANVVRKGQFDDNTDNLLSYSTVNTGGSIHFLFNNNERNSMLLTDHAIAADGSVKRNPTFKNLDKGYEFLPRFGKQVSSKQTIIPCIYRNYICFAKIEF